MINCPNCHKKNDLDSKFCVHCGEEILTTGDEEEIIKEQKTQLINKSILDIPTNNILKYDEESYFWKSDKIEFIFVIIVAMFIFATTYNFTLLNLSDYEIPYLVPIIDKLRWMVVQFIAIAVIGFAGPIMRVITDNSKLLDKKGNYQFRVDSKGNETEVTITSTTVEGFFNPNSIVEVFTYFGIAIAVNALMSFLMNYPMTIFNLTTSMIAFAIITSVSEELLFSYGFQRIFEPYINVFSIPLVTGLFVVYHMMVYSQNIGALIYVAIGRAAYAIVYLFSKRISSVTLAHMANNIIAFQNTSPAFSIFSIYFSFLL